MKLFKPRDIIVYTALAAVIAVLFFALVFSDNQIEGIEIYGAGGLIYEYDFVKGESKIYDGAVSEASFDGGLVVTIESGRRLNVITVDSVNKSAVMTEASCAGRDCLSFPKITKPNQIIICAANGIKVVGKGGGSTVIPSGKIPALGKRRNYIYSAFFDKAQALDLLSIFWQTT